jgi:protocatechuate 3,4-dioxygenase beta subunit
MHRRDLLLLGVAALGLRPGRGRAGPPEAPPRRARPNLYQCEGCEAALERDPMTLSSSARIGPGVDRGEPLRLTGTVYRPDGRTPAPGVVLYAYQTNAEGRYANGSPGTEPSRRHGRLRGWLKTGPDGRYRFDTIKPAPYPNDTLPAHVHFTVLEPGRRPYWIDDLVFAGEFGVTDAYRKALTNKGGDGVVTLRRDPDGALVARRDIVLEVHPD